MRVGILTQHYPPEPFHRPADLARWLTGRGHQVSVITGFPYYQAGALYPGTRMRVWSREVVAGVNVLRVPLYPDHSRSAVRRILNYGSFSISATVLGCVLSGPVEVMYVEHPSTILGLAACFLSRVRRVPFVYGVDDVWPESVEASGMLRHHTLLKTIDRLERVVYRRAGAIAVISEGNRRQLIAKGVPPDKVHFIPHYANEDIFRPVPPDPCRRPLGASARRRCVRTDDSLEDRGIHGLCTANHHGDERRCGRARAIDAGRCDLSSGKPQGPGGGRARVACDDPRDAGGYGGGGSAGLSAIAHEEGRLRTG